MNKLKVGSLYILYTNYETISGTKVKVIGTLTYDQHTRVSYSMATLAVNERVISVKDEDLERAIGEDNIYWCQALEANPDGSYSEYLVWDSIVNYNKTTAINDDIEFKLNVKINDNSTITIAQIQNALENALKQGFGKGIEYEISYSQSALASSKNNGAEGVMTTTLTEEVLGNAESIINSLNGYAATLVPAAEKITNSNISGNLDDIKESISTIKSQLSMISQGI